MRLLSMFLEAAGAREVILETPSVQEDGSLDRFGKRIFHWVSSLLAVNGIEPLVR